MSSWVILGWILAILPGIAHPDELEQSLQPLLASLCDFSVDLPWEFQHDSAARSLLPWKIVLGWVPRSLLCQYPLVVQRMIFCLLSSYAVTRLVPEQRRVLSTFAYLFFVSRPYSNTLEWLLLCLLWNLVFEWKRSFKTSLFIGVLSVTGCYVRITFPAFATPLVLLYMYQQNFRFRVLVHLCLGVLLAFGIFIWHDSLYYGRFVIPPLDNLLYNTQSDNLALHGLHPRYNHLLINMPLLFGQVWLQLLLRAQSILNTSSTPISLKQRTALIMLLSGLGILSLFPHQEPRFLVPLLLPLSQFHSPKFKNPLLRILRMGQVVCAVFFAVAHQAGILPCTQYLVTRTGEQPQHALSMASASCFVIWKTYPFPTTLFIRRDGTASVKHLTGLTRQQVEQYMLAHPQCRLITPQWMMVSGTHIADGDTIESDGFQSSLELDEQCHWWPHIGLDDLDLLVRVRSVHQLRLGVYKVKRQ